MPKRQRNYIRDEKLTLGELNAAFVSEKIIENKSPATIKNYAKSFIKFCDDMGIDMETFEARNLTKYMVYNWAGKLQLDGLSAASINHYLRDIRAFCYWMESEGYLTEGFDVKLLKEQETAPKSYTDEEIEALLRQPYNMDDFVEVRTWVVVNLICATGLRRGTVCELRMEDVNIAGRMIIASHTKNKKFLRVPISSALLPVLRQWVNEWRYDAEEKDYFFCSIDGGKMSENALRLAYERYCAKRKVNRTSLHALRHTFAKNAVLQGISPFELRELLGHKDVAMSSRYVKFFAEEINPFYDKYSLLDTKSHNSSNRSPVRRKRKE